MRILVLIFSIFFYFTGHSQIWPKILLQNEKTFPFSIIEYYDRGYLIGGWYITNQGAPINGLLVKTDINGDLLWNKRLGENNDGTGVFDVDQTSDGGMIIAGSVEQTDPWGDPFIMKMNACGENEWCRIYKIVSDTFDYANSIYQVPGGYIAYIYRTGSLWANDHIHLFRLDQNGETIWQQMYARTDTAFLGAAGEHMMITPDYHYMISGYCYYPDSVGSTIKYLKPLIIKIDSSGVVDWEIPWHNVSGEIFHGMAFNSIVDDQGTIFTCGRHIESDDSIPGDRPTIMKTDSLGNELSYYDMVPDSWQAVFFTINWFQDSTIALGGGWSYSYNDHHQGVFKVDRLGNILDSVEVFSTIYSFSDAVTTFDNKLFLVSGQHINNQWRTYIWKLNSDLEYDTLYTYPYVYDSLCPHPIASDTIPLDCVIVGLDEPFQNPETGRLKVYPNPAQDKIHIMIPDQIKTQTHSPVFNLTTVYHQWRSATVEIYDLFGRRMFSKEITQSVKELETDVTAWPQGMYVVRLVYNGQTVGSEKIVVE